MAHPVDKTNYQPRLTITDEFNVINIEPRSFDPLVPISIISSIAFIALMIVSYMFAPVALSVSLTIAGVLGLPFGFGLAKGIEVLKTNAFLPSANTVNGYRGLFNATLQVSDGTKLRGSFVPGTSRRKPIEEKEIIVVFHGNGEIANKRYVEERRAEFKGTDIIDIDYRGCGGSDGSIGSHKKMITDGKELALALYQRGYRRFKFFGHSMGGSIAPSVKEFIDQRKTDQESKLIAYHTFHSFDSAAKHMISDIQKNASDVCVIQKGLSAAKCLCTPLLKMIGWNYKFSADRWAALKGDKVAYGGGSGDNVIGPEASLATHLQTRGLQAKVRRMMHMQILFT